MQLLTKESLSLQQQASELTENLRSLFERLMMARAPKREVELSSLEIRTLVHLRLKGSSIMTDIANSLSVPLSTATHGVDRLVQKSMVVRSKSDQDRRLVQVSLSEQGREFQQEFFAYQLLMARDMLAPLTGSERETFLELLAKMAQLAQPDAGSRLV